ncbi:IS607 family transposase, partial [Limosilactobacillus mucosae]|nr:IS607 family transposase [Limosilactobacillus mucosae]
PKTSPDRELVDDLVSIIHVFSCRLYGLRRYKTKIEKDPNLKGGDSK